MSYCYIENKRDICGANKLLDYYNENIVKIAEILKTNQKAIPRNIVICLEQGEGAAYIRNKGRIIYRFKNTEEILQDKGRLIHEATHVVQNYLFDINQFPACSVWAEGIADYCRFKLDRDFDLKIARPFDPERNSKHAAHFLDWLSIKYIDVVSNLNLLIRNRANELGNHNTIFGLLIQKNFNDLKREYF